MIKGVGPPLATCCPRLPEKGGGGEVEKEEKEGEEGEEKEKGEEEEGGMVSTQQPPSNHPSFPPLPLLGWGGGGRGATPPRFNPLALTPAQPISTHISSSTKNIFQENVHFDFLLCPRVRFTITTIDPYLIFVSSTRSGASVKFLDECKKIPEEP